MLNSPRPGLDGQQASLSTDPMGPTVHGAIESAEALAHRAAERTRAQANRLLDAGSAHIRERPLQSVLVAAATGAVLMLLMELVVRSAASSTSR
jgi:ElaB/YqjD/DUF883 family membrane-anchored ribosome-binding protein